MSLIKSSFLLVGPWPPQLKELGAEIVPDLGEAKRLLKTHVFQVIGLSVTSLVEKKFHEIYQEILQASPATQLIAVIPPNYPSDQIASLHGQYRFYKIFSQYFFEGIESELYLTLEYSRQRQQDEELLKLVNEQRQQLLHLQSELEQRVEKRTKYLTESRRKLFITNSRIEGFRKSLMSVHQSTSLPDIERLLSANLSTIVDLAWIRIFFKPQDLEFEKQVQQKLTFTILKIPLYVSHEQIGAIFFMRSVDKTFLKDEEDFLTRVAEAVSLALDRIQKFRALENVKEQWENTFNALSEPVVIIDTNYDVVQINRSGQKSSGLKCYEQVFQRTTPCEGCLRGENFKLKNQSSTFEVFSQALTLENQGAPVFVNFYHDISEKSLIEQQILDSARMAELGTIGSSIAHELNNPLGGILTFSQLLKMELPKDHPLYPDILAIEQGAQRCKEIIQNLLGFSRNPGADQIAKVDLFEICDRAFKITALKAKALGIQIDLQFQKNDFYLQGHFNLLAQAIQNILQLAFHQLELSSAPNKKISLALVGTELFIRSSEKMVTDGKNIHGLGLPVAQQILHDHSATLDISPGQSGEWQAKISFQRPVLLA